MINITILVLIIYNFESLNNDEIYQASFKNLYYSSTIFLLSINVIFAFLLFLIIFFQAKFISNNETTSENIRRLNNVANPFDNGCKKNIKEFMNDMTAFKQIVTYSENAKGYLLGVQLITEYLSLVSRRSSKASGISQVERKSDLNITTSSAKTSDRIIEEKEVN